jgi:hypothetical protein
MNIGQLQESSQIFASGAEPSGKLSFLAMSSIFTFPSVGLCMQENELLSTAVVLGSVSSSWRQIWQTCIPGFIGIASRPDSLSLASGSPQTQDEPRSRWRLCLRPPGRSVGYSGYSTTWYYVTPVLHGYHSIAGNVHNAIISLYVDEFLATTPHSLRPFGRCDR